MDFLDNHDSYRAILATFLLGPSRELLEPGSRRHSFDFACADSFLFEALCQLFDKEQPKHKTTIAATFPLPASTRLTQPIEEGG